MFFHHALSIKMIYGLFVIQEIRKKNRIQVETVKSKI